MDNLQLMLSEIATRHESDIRDEVRRNRLLACLRAARRQRRRA